LCDVSSHYRYWHHLMPVLVIPYPYWYIHTTLIGPPCALANWGSSSWKGPLTVWGAIYAMYRMNLSVAQYVCMLLHPAQYTVCSPSMSAPCNYLAVKNAQCMEVSSIIFIDVNQVSCQGVIPTKSCAALTEGSSSWKKGPLSEGPI
jgi:hypothetical protein